MNATPTSKSAQAKEIIKRSLAKGEWQDYLPSERALANELMISRACLRQALETLTLEGYIAQSEQSKRRKVLKQPEIDPIHSHVIFLTSRPETEATVPSLIQIAELRNNLSKSDQKLSVVAPAFYSHQNVTDATMKKFVATYPDSRWVLHQCPEHVQRWFDKQSIPAIISGSRFGGVQLPVIDVDLKSACRHATGILIAKGHRRLGLIRFRTQLAGDDLAQEGMTEAIAGSTCSEEIQRPSIIEHNFHSENLASSLNKIYTAPAPPTALIAVNDHHFISTFTYLMSKGIRIPEDVSIICLADNPELKHFHPQPTYYSCGKKRIQAISKHLHAPTLHTKTLVSPEIIHGKSVAAVAE